MVPDQRWQFQQFPHEITAVNYINMTDAEVVRGGRWMGAEGMKAWVLR
jgi:hypothetical protein